MHHKFTIIDKKTLLCGSFNFTKNAEKKNHENCLIIKSEDHVVNEFQNLFENLWSEVEGQRKRDLKANVKRGKDND